MPNHARTSPLPEHKQPRVLDKFRVVKESSPKPEPAKAAKAAKVHTRPNGMLKVNPKGENARMAKANKANSPFLRIDKDVRQLILFHTLGWNEYTIHVPRDTPVARNVDARHQTGIALLQTCTQIYKEAALIPLTMNTFYIQPHLLDRWAASLLAGQLKNVTCIRVNYGEAVWGIRDLAQFEGLKKLVVTYTPPCGPRKLQSVTDLLGEKSGHPNLTVDFLDLE